MFVPTTKSIYCQFPLRLCRCDHCNFCIHHVQFSLKFFLCNSFSRVSTKLARFSLFLFPIEFVNLLSAIWGQGGDNCGTGDFSIDVVGGCPLGITRASFCFKNKVEPVYFLIVRSMPLRPKMKKKTQMKKNLRGKTTNVVNPTNEEKLFWRKTTNEEKHTQMRKNHNRKNILLKKNHKWRKTHKWRKLT